MRNRFLLAALMSVLCLNFAFAQDGFLQGKVIDKQTKEPLLANLLLLQNGVRKATKQTDFDGTFRIGPVSPGTYDLKIMYIGYPDQLITGISVKGDKTVSVPTIEMFITDESGIKLTEVVIIKHRDPAFERDQTTTGEVLTRKDIKNFAIRDVNGMAATSGGTVSTDRGFYSKGSRSNSNVYYVDGIRLPGTGAPNIPQGAIDQLSTITGGVPAEYGDATGSIISITTRGPSKKYFGGVEVLSSQFLDEFGYNLLEGTISGPLIMRGKGDTATPLLGFFVGGNVSYIKVSDPPAIQVYNVNDETLQQLKNDPISQSPLGAGFIPNAEYVTTNNMDRSRVRPNTSQFSYALTGKFDFQPVDNINITFGGSADRSRRNEYIYTYSMFNFENNPERIDENWRGFARFRQTFKTSTDSNAVIKNAYYTVQADFTRTNFSRWDEDLKDNYFAYGYLGKFDRNYTPNYVRQTRRINGKDVNALYFTGYEENGVSFTPGGYNPVGENYTKRFFELSDNDVQNYSEIIEKGGLLNGQSPQNIYSLWSGVGSRFTSVQKRQNDQYSINASGAVDIKAGSGIHALKFGIQYEERTDRGYNVGSDAAVQGLWTLARQHINSHLVLDTLNPIYNEDPGSFNDTVNYKYISANQSTFDKNFRQYLIDKGERDANGRLIDDQTFINVDRYSPEDLKLNMFSPDELLNNGNSYLSYWGYDYLGNKQTSKTNVNDFLDPQKRSISAYNPIYIAGYIQDKFEFKDLIFRVGLRVDRFDANQLVLQDPYSLYPIKNAGEVTQINQQNVTHPGNIGEDYAVYVDDAFNPTKVVGYRSGARWYDASGAEVLDPSVIAQETKTGSIQPYLSNPENVSQSSELRITKESFRDYTPQVNFMPRVSFSFPISDKAAFYANYDVLTQRPRNGNIATLYDYYYLRAKATETIANPDLKPEKRINYEIGFKQTIGNQSAITLQAFYGEIRDLIQRVAYNYAYPQTYFTFGNVDFGTVKGLMFGYDFRRVKSSGIQLNLNYTLQFAEGTGSDDASGQNLINSGQPNLRTPFPLDYDVRHQIVGVIDYRFGEGEEFAGTRGTWFENVFENTGFNLILNTRSGTPYTRQSNLTYGSGVVVGVAQRSSITGGINAARLPWQFRADLRFDKDFYIKTKRDNNDAGTNQSPVYINAYIVMQNLLDARNIVSVYRYTGLPDDDGYLNSVEGQKEADRAVSRQAYIDQYTIKVNNPDNYTQPRTIRLGASFNF